MLRMGLIGKQPDQLRNFDRKNIFSNSAVVTQNLSIEQVTCSPRNRNYSSREVNCYAPPGLNPKLHACELKSLPRRHGVARGKNVSGDSGPKR